MNALKHAITILGSQTQLAKAIGVAQPTIHDWLFRLHGNVPAARCRAIEAATGGRVTRYQLRPDVFGPGPEDSPAPGME